MWLASWRCLMVGGLSSSPHSPLPGLRQCPHNQTKQPMRASASHSAIYDPAWKAICHPLTVFCLTHMPAWIQHGAKPHVWRITGSILEVGTITVDFPEGVTKYTTAPKKQERPGVYTSWQRVDVMLVESWHFLSPPPSIFLLLGTIPPVHGHHGNHSGLMCPWLLNHSLLVQHQATHPRGRRGIENSIPRTIQLTGPRGTPNS